MWMQNLIIVCWCITVLYALHLLNLLNETEYCFRSTLAKRVNPSFLAQDYGYDIELAPIVETNASANSPFPNYLVSPKESYVKCAKVYSGCTHHACTHVFISICNPTVVHIHCSVEVRANLICIVTLIIGYLQLKMLTKPFCRSQIAFSLHSWIMQTLPKDNLSLGTRLPAT